MRGNKLMNYKEHLKIILEIFNNNKYKIVPYIKTRIKKIVNNKWLVSISLTFVFTFFLVSFIIGIHNTISILASNFKPKKEYFTTENYFLVDQNPYIKDIYQLTMFLDSGNTQVTIKLDTEDIKKLNNIITKNVK